MNRKNLFYIVFGIFLGSSLEWGCVKDENPTIVEGKVIDAKTGAGLDSVEITYETRAIPKDIHDEPPVSSHTIKTTNEGLFSINLEPGIQFTGVVYFNKPGYNQLILSAGTYFRVKSGKKNNVSINLWVVDSWLNLTIANSHPLHDSIFITIENKTIHPDIFAGGINSNPISLAFGHQLTQIFPFSSNTYTTIKWANSLLEYQQNPIIDSFLMPNTDTSQVIISY